MESEEREKVNSLKKKVPVAFAATSAFEIS